MIRFSASIILPSQQNSICLGTELTLDATPDPANSSFPSGKPTWSADGLTTYLSATSGTSITINNQAPAGTYLVKASHNNTKVIKVVIAEVELQSLAVENATQENVTGVNNWAAVKKSNEYVIVTAKFNPDIPLDVLPSGFTWTGGEAVPGKPIQRRVSKGTSAQITVEASLGQVSKDVDIWIIWADITIHTSGTQPADAVQLSSEYGGTNLGPFESTTRVGASMTLEATLTPSRINEVIKSGWEIKRTMTYRDWRDDQKREETNKNDDSNAIWTVTTPTTSDKIYDTDAPNDTNTFTSYVESHNNFVQWIEWNNEKCSDNADWSLEYKYTKTGSTCTKIYNVISTTHITIPLNPTIP